MVPVFNYFMKNINYSFRIILIYKTNSVQLLNFNFIKDVIIYILQFNRSLIREKTFFFFFSLQIFKERKKNEKYDFFGKIL